MQLPRIHFSYKVHAIILNGWSEPENSSGRRFVFDFMEGGQNYFNGGSGCTGVFLFAQTAALYSAPKPRYYPVAYRQAQPGAFTNFLSGKERIEDLAQVFPLDSA